ncbi:hypothetical protein EC973_001353 [Apophysomyces ossiformis]|uniref:Mitochondrial carrier protein n=1 Tax=Apophysomyces ossiformis TaxID=679940 RepID=A0A8H7ETZ7_9FUNG|nr:hypothetical protein EC973_001353 [Apophysomyces ossiformis]
MGWIGGASGIIIGSPLDVLKARLQAPKVAPLVSTGTGQTATSWETLKQLVVTEGSGSLFKGVLSPVVGLAGLNAILFVSYGSIMRYFEQQQPLGTAPSLSHVYLAGCGAGIAGFFFTTPTELVKIQAQISRIPKSTFQVTKEIFERNGLRGLLSNERANAGFYQGGWITMIRDAPSYGIYFWVYEGMKRFLEVDPTTEAGSGNAWKLLLAGGLAGAVSWTSIYPIDVVKSRLQMQVQPRQQQPRFQQERAAVPHPAHSYSILNGSRNISSSSSSSSGSSSRNSSAMSSFPERSALLSGRIDQPYTSIKDCVIRSYKTEGLGVFFRGLWPTILRGFPVNAVTFYVYEIVLNMLESQ